MVAGCTPIGPKADSTWVLTASAYPCGNSSFTSIFAIRLHLALPAVRREVHPLTIAPCVDVRKGQAFPRARRRPSPIHCGNGSGPDTDEGAQRTQPLICNQATKVALLFGQGHRDDCFRNWSGLGRGDLLLPFTIIAGVVRAELSGEPIEKMDLTHTVLLATLPSNPHVHPLEQFNCLDKSNSGVLRLFLFS